jgi:hypothetical protein
MAWATNALEFESRYGQEFSLLHVVQIVSGVYSTYPTGTSGSFPAVKRSGRETDHSPLASAEVKKMWICAATPHKRLKFHINKLHS